jgi:hypothetical protein
MKHDLDGIRGRRICVTLDSGSHIIAREPFWEARPNTEDRPTSRQKLVDDEYRLPRRHLRVPLTLAKKRIVWLLSDPEERELTLARAKIGSPGSGSVRV